MRLLYLIDSLEPGGAERSLAAMAPYLIAGGVRLDVGYLKTGAGVHADLLSSGAHLAPLSGRGGRAGWLHRTMRLIADRRPDLIHTTLFDADIVGRSAAWWAGIPVVSSLVNVGYGKEQASSPGLRPWKVRAAQAADAATARTVRRFHAVTLEVAAVMARRLCIARDRIEVIPRGRDPLSLGTRTLTRSASVRELLGIAPSAAVVLAVARQEHQKGLDVLIAGFSTVADRRPDACLLLAGRQGSATPSLRQSVDRLGLAERVRFLGAREDVGDLLCAADVFVLPSRWEGMPGALLEAMALEAPVVASDIRGVRDVVGTEDVARLVPIDDPLSLAAAVLEVLADAAKTRDRALAARALFERGFTIQRAAERVLGFYARSLRPA
jgi:glycosyltransferase involved in cell wall biosynthesis